VEKLEAISNSCEQSEDSNKTIDGMELYDSEHDSLPSTSKCGACANV
jgi:hypothetical protein